jgi:3-oxoacyl-[acyl-carrier protein] reductase
VTEAIEGKVVVVSGSGGGIGREICRLFLEAGADLVALYRNRSEFGRIRVPEHARGTLIGAKVDLSRESEIDAAVDWIQREHRTIDVLINGAGVGNFGPIDSITSKQWRAMVDVNLSGTFLLTRRVVGVMKERGSGVIINIASIAGIRGYPKCSAYGATKAGVIGLTRCLAEELIPFGIRVMAISPGSVDTPFQDHIPKVIPREKMIRPEDVAKTVLFAASLPERALLDEVVIRPRVLD